MVELDESENLKEAHIDADYLVRSIHEYPPLHLELI